MKQILVPIDPGQPARTRSAIEQVARIGREEPVTVHLLRVQPRLSSHVALCFGAGELQALQQAAGAEDLQFAKGLLDIAGVPCTTTVRIGRSAPTIVEVARELRCDRIVFGQEEPGLAGRIFGSLAQQVRQILGASGDPQVIGS